MSQDKPVLSREQIELRKARIRWMRSGEHLEGQVPPPRINLTTEQELALCDLALSALERQGSGWISVEERLPEIGALVIVQGGVAYQRGTLKNWYTVTGFDYPGRPIQWEVTHWQPLPPPPQAQDAQTGEGK